MRVVFSISSEIKNYWIGFPNFAQMIEFQFTGNLANEIPKVISWAFTIIFILYILYSFKKNWNRDAIKPAKLAILIYFVVIAFIGIVSIISEPILYARYLLAITGIFIFVISILLSTEKPRVILTLCLLTLLVSLIVNINNININYDKSNKELISYMDENVQEKDIFIADDSLLGLTLATELKIDNANTYFYNMYNWSVEEAYKAFGVIIDKVKELDNFEGRIWFVNRDSSVASKFADDLGNCNIISTQSFQKAYKDENYVITLIERKLEND